MHTILHEPKDVITEENLAACVIEEGKTTSKDGLYGSVLQLLALSTVLQCNITTCLPRGVRLYASPLFVGTVKPLEARPTPYKLHCGNENPHIMWTKTGLTEQQVTRCGYITTNHVVPVVKLTCRKSTEHGKYRYLII